MTDTLRIATESGTTEVLCYWRNDVLAVTRDIGRLTRDGEEVPAAVEDGWTLTHIQSGRCLGGLATVANEPDTLRALAEHLTPVVPWATTPLVALLGDVGLRRKVIEAARVFWDARESREVR